MYGLLVPLQKSVFVGRKIAGAILAVTHQALN
jgi:hypothetical protein